MVLGRTLLTPSENTVSGTVEVIALQGDIFSRKLFVKNDFRKSVFWEKPTDI